MQHHSIAHYTVWCTHMRLLLFSVIPIWYRYAKNTTDMYGFSDSQLDYWCNIKWHCRIFCAIWGSIDPLWIQNDPHFHGVCSILPSTIAALCLIHLLTEQWYTIGGALVGWVGPVWCRVKYLSGSIQSVTVLSLISQLAPKAQ